MVVVKRWHRQCALHSMDRTRVLIILPKQWIEARGCERFSNPDMMDRVPFAFSREWRDRSADHGR
jgi:hypothetical protein